MLTREEDEAIERVSMQNRKENQTENVSHARWNVNSAPPLVQCPALIDALLSGSDSAS